MKPTVLLNLFVSLLLLAGSAGAAARPRSGAPVADTVYRLQLTLPSEMSEEARGIFRQRLQAALGKAGLLGSGRAAATLEVVMTRYQMRPGAARAWVGAMAGTDRLDSTVSVRAPGKGSVTQQFSVSSKNVTAWGSSRGLIQKHADQIVRRLR